MKQVLALPRRVASRLQPSQRDTLVGAFSYHHSYAEDIIAGTSQASTIVLQVARADRGVINKAFEQVKRKRQIPRRIILINKYGEVVSLTRADILKSNGRNKLKGFL